VPSYLIADSSEIESGWFREADTVGITAGASAPEELVDDVVAALRSTGPIELSVLPGITENVEFRLPAELLRARLARAAAS
jgi:4-hydroxy-3-methylbut-2-en-1-yl diphosphate reductase